MKQHIAIVGGGISGLTVAYVLHRDHADTCETTLFETSGRGGGILETVRQDGFTIECGPDAWVTEKSWAEQLARELGLADELLPSNDAQRRTYIAQRGKLTPLPDAMRMMVPTELAPMLASPLFSAAAKQAYLAEPSRADELRATALLRRSPEADESVAAFVERHFGSEVTETVAGPLLAGIFGGDIHKLSARALLAPFVAMEAEHGSLISALQQHAHAPATSVFTTLSSGLGTLVDRLLGALPDTCVQLRTPVLTLRSAGSAWVLETTRGEQSFDRILLATPLDATRQLLSSMHDPSAAAAAACLPAEASSSLIVALGYGSEAAKAIEIPPGFGLLVAPGAHTHPATLLACTFLHQKFPRRVAPGSVLLRAFFGSTAADELVDRTDGQIAAVAREQLSALLGPLPARAEITVVRRWPRSLPQYEVGHLQRMAQFDTALAAIPGLAVAGNAYRGVGIPDLIRDATTTAKRLAQNEV